MKYTPGTTKPSAIGRGRSSFLFAFFVALIVALLVSTANAAPVVNSQLKTKNRNYIILIRNTSFTEHLNYITSTIKHQNRLRRRNNLPQRSDSSIRRRFRFPSIDAAVLVTSLDDAAKEEIFKYQEPLPNVFMELDRQVYFQEEDADAGEEEELSSPPNEKFRAQQNASWGLDRIDGKNDTFYTFMASAGKNTDVYVLDSGVIPNANEFDNRMTVFPFNRTATLEHGTFVSSIIGSKSYGVAKEANLHSVQVARPDGTIMLSTTIAGIKYIISERKKANNTRKCVVNISLGVPYSLTLNTLMESLVLGADCVVISAAGNGHNSSCGMSPSSSPLVISVGNADREDRINPSSNYGPCVTTFAPGTQVEGLGFDGLKRKTGTSFSAPFVSGVAALWRTERPDLNALGIVNLIRERSEKGVVKLNETLAEEDFIYGQTPTDMLVATLA